MFTSFYMRIRGYVQIWRYIIFVIYYYYLLCCRICSHRDAMRLWRMRNRQPLFWATILGCTAVMGDFGANSGVLSVVRILLLADPNKSSAPSNIGATPNHSHYPTWLHPSWSERLCLYMFHHVWRRAPEMLNSVGIKTEFCIHDFR